jgi:thiol-disulfide isomerase/thioredoxin
MKLTTAFLVVSLAAVFVATTVSAQSLTGTWQATVKVGGLDIPFRMEILGSNAEPRGVFFNGMERLFSTSGTFTDGAIEIKWDYLASTLKATLKDGELVGVYERARSSPYAFRARHEVNDEMITIGRTPPKPASAPNINGIWEIHDVSSSKGEQAWSLVVEQQGNNAFATILRVDGDTGTLTGSLRDGKFVLSHFSGMRPSLLEITPVSAGSLTLTLNGKGKMSAIRPAEARAKGLPEPSDPTKHTGVKDATEPFHFKFPDLNGNVISETDPKFKGKVVLVNISGSWCPNCHDEAPFLAALYRDYRDKGLEIVALSFEEADQLKDPTRLRAFIARYGIGYTVLLGGTTDEASAKLPQAKNWDAWPTTFFLGRDGRVREVHSGFPSRASGELYTQATHEFTALIEKLLAEVDCHCAD